MAKSYRNITKDNKWQETVTKQSNRELERQKYNLQNSETKIYSQKLNILT
jgi:hypothetical protein